jgi:hypothetical protein
MCALLWLPQVLAIDTSIRDGGEVSWWEPDLLPEEMEVVVEGEGEEGEGARQRLPTGKLVSFARCLESNYFTQLLSWSYKVLLNLSLLRLRWRTALCYHWGKLHHGI